MDVTEESTRLPPTNGCDARSLTRVLVILVNMLKLMPARGTPRTRTGSIRRFRDCTVHGVWASAVVVQLHRTTPRGCHVVASVPLYEAVVTAALARRFVRHCVAVSTLERDLMLDPGGLHHARA